MHRFQKLDKFAKDRQSFCRLAAISEKIDGPWQICRGLCYNASLECLLSNDHICPSSVFLCIMSSEKLYRPGTVFWP